MNAFAWNSKQLIRGIHPSLEIMLILRFHFSVHFVRGRAKKITYNLKSLKLLSGYFLTHSVLDNKIFNIVCRKIQFLMQVFFYFIFRKIID